MIQLKNHKRSSFSAQIPFVFDQASPVCHLAGHSHPEQAPQTPSQAPSVPAVLRVAAEAARAARAEKVPSMPSVKASK